MSNGIPSDVRDRIIAAAQELAERDGRLPTVDAVRRQARVDMNSASAIMREWRRAQTVRAAPVAVAIPDAVQAKASESLAALWLAAQELANASLRAAQSAWDIERQELEALRAELSQAFEAQTLELEQARAESTRDQEQLKQQAIVAEEGLAKLRAEVSGLKEQLAAERAKLTAITGERDRLYTLAQQSPTPVAQSQVSEPVAPKLTKPKTRKKVQPPSV